MADFDSDDIESVLDELEAALALGDQARAEAMLVALRPRIASVVAVATALQRRFERLALTVADPARNQDAAPLGASVAVELPMTMLTDESDEPLEHGVPGTRTLATRLKIGHTLGVDLRSADDVVTNELAGLATAPAPQPSVRQGHMYRVWFGTNRQPLEPDHPERGFGSARSRETRYGHVDVWVPRAHRFGETGSSFLKRLMRFEFSDDRLQVRAITTGNGATVWSALQAQMDAANQRGEPADGLVFLHGYKTTFEEAALRAAQIGVDLHVSGATSFFSWPSRGKLDAYTADEASIEASEAAITQYLCDFSAQSGAQRVHVIAHSMGNRGLLRALQRIAAMAETRTRVKFGQIILAAPDLDSDLFLDLAHLYPAYSQRTTLYASASDLPVHASAHIHGAPRAGYFLPYTVAPDIDTIAVPDFDVDLLGHSYFAQAEALLHDIFDLLQRNAPPSQRQRFAKQTEDGPRVWSLVR